MIEIQINAPQMELKPQTKTIEVMKPTHDTLKDAYQDGYTTGNEEGYNNGYTTGSSEGYNAGKTDGYESGKADGYNEGYNNGWNVGNNDGLTEGYNNGYTTGKADGVQSEYDRFWDVYQQNKGGVLNFSYAFAGYRWKAGSTFKPKYNIVPSDATGMFFYFNAGSADIPVDMVEYLDGLGVSLDFSQCKILNTTFYGNCKISRLGTIDTRNCSNGNLYMTFGTQHLITIDNLIISEKYTNTLSSLFTAECSNLTNLTISGVIGANFKVSTCPKLTHTSLMSIINHLKDFSGTTTTKTLTLGTTNLNKLTAAEKAIATDKGWTLA